MAYPTVSDGVISPLTPISADVATSSEELVATHRHLCARAARRFLRPGIERSDLEQVAALGLVKASRRYDERTRTPFEAYAWVTVLGELMHYVRDYENAIRLPRRLRSIERRVDRAREAYVSQYGREPSHAEVAGALAMPKACVEQLRSARELIRPISLDDPARAVPRESEVMGVEDRLLIADSFARLDALERRIVGGVYFLGLTQSQLARALHLSPKRVSRIHLGALATMRRAWL